MVFRSDRFLLGGELADVLQVETDGDRLGREWEGVATESGPLPADVSPKKRHRRHYARTGSNHQPPEVETE